VNPNEQQVEGLQCYSSIANVPERVDKVSMYVRPAVGVKLLPDIAQRGCGELWLNPGTESDQVVAEAERLGLKVVQACSIIGVGVSPGSL
jgi:predicted CoA-binding protein